MLTKTSQGMFTKTSRVNNQTLLMYSTTGKTWYSDPEQANQRGRTTSKALDLILGSAEEAISQLHCTANKFTHVHSCERCGKSYSHDKVVALDDGPVPHYCDEYIDISKIHGCH